MGFDKPQPAPRVNRTLPAVTGTGALGGGRALDTRRLPLISWPHPNPRFAMPSDVLKIKTSIPQGVVIAGRPFSLTTTVTNPYEEPIEIMHYTYLIPYQVQWIHDATFDQKFTEYSSYSFIRQWFASSILAAAARPPGAAMVFGNQSGTGSGVQMVAPGEQQSYSFKAIMPQWLFITGGQFSFQGLIVYRRAGTVHTSNFEVAFPFRPPLRSISLGAVLGAILGSTAKVLKDNGPDILQQKPGGVVTATILAIILSTIAVVYSSRRSNESQPVLTVEDVWGGMILGFLIGYLGNEFFQTIVPIQSAPGG